MPRPNGFQTWLNKKNSEQKTELKNLVLTSRTSKIAHQTMKKRGFRGSYDTILNFRNTNKQNSTEAIAAGVAVFEQKMVEATQSASDPIENALILCSEMNALCSKLVGLLISRDWTDGGEPLNIRDALKLAGIVPSLSRASVGGLIELFNLRKAMDYEDAAQALFEAILIESEATYSAESPESLPIVATIVKQVRVRHDADVERCLVPSVRQTKSL